MKDVVAEYVSWYDDLMKRNVLQDVLEASNHMNKLCQEWLPDHTDLPSVMTKVRVVGRSFLTNMERHLKRDEEKLNDGPYLLAVLLHQNAAEVDERIRNLSTATDPWSVDAEQNVINIVQWMQDRIAEVQKKKMYSFCSKYLFCHTQNVYIYDSRARASLAHIMPITRRKKGEPRPNEYEQYAHRLARLGRILTEAVPERNPDVRNVDLFLYAQDQASRKKDSTS